MVSVGDSVYPTSESAADRTFAPGGKKKLAKELENDLDNVQKHISDVDAENAQATNDDDQERIFAAINKLLPRGFLDLNNQVKERMRGWASEAGEAELQHMNPKQRYESNLIIKLAEYCRKTGDYAKAEKLYSEALTWRRQHLGDTDPQTIDAIAGLGYLLEYQGSELHCEQARPLLCEALQLRQRVLAADHPDIFVSMNDLGNLYMHQYPGIEDLDEAEKLYTQALAGRRRTLAADDYGVLQSVNNLGRLKVRRGLKKEAASLFEEAVSGRESSLGSEHPTTLYSKHRLGKLYTELHEYGKARGLYLAALEGQRRKLGDDNEDTLSTILDLGLLFEKVWKGEVSQPTLLSRSRSTSFSEAEKYLVEAVEGFKKKKGLHDRDTCSALAALDRVRSFDDLSAECVTPAESMSEPEPETDFEPDSDTEVQRRCAATPPPVDTHSH